MTRPLAPTPTVASQAASPPHRRPVVATSAGLQWLAAPPTVGGTADHPEHSDHPDRLGGVEVGAVHFDGAGLWGLGDRRDLYRVDADGVSLVASLPAGASGTCVLGHRGDVFVGGDAAGLWRLDGARLVEVAAFQEAPTRDGWHTPWGGPPAVLSMAAHGDDLYVGVHVGGILRTSDAGASWTPTIDLEVDVHQVAVDAAGGVWAANGDGGLAHSRDRGDTWEVHTDGLHATYLLAVAVTDDGVLVGASSGHAGRDGALYRFDGARFERCGGGLPDDFHGAVAPRHLAAAGADAVVALPDGDVYASADAGRTWSRVEEALPGVGEVTLVPSA